MIPVGGILRALDFGANWDEDNRVATLNRFNREIIIRDGEQSFTINGVMRHLPAPVIIVEGHMMVPFVEFIDAIGGRSNLDTNNTINIFITR
ncbi:MAG: copper amine oxidase N-terminal domain-containing protein [Turicibacter sp.]|nr:copper amine oxidase N-terminal domain-containing protein [Turicibacter sp.]